MNEAVTPTKYAFDERWAPALKSDGHVQVSTFFLENYHRLQPYPLTHGEAMFVVHLMQHKWGAKAPFPSYRTLAQRMGVSIKTTRRFAASLQQKKYLYREVRIGVTNLFYLDKLITALVALKNGGTVPPKRKLPPRRK
jgi:hypothetical protein